MATARDAAIVLRLTDYSETSQIVSLLTAEHGLTRVIAKGARRSTKKRFATGLDLLELGDLSWIPPRGDATLGTLTDWVQRDIFAGLRGALVRLYGGLYCAELSLALIESDDPHPELFAALRRVLGDLATGAEPAAALATFQAALLKALGYFPNLSECVSCGKSASARTAVQFTATGGGLLCPACERHYREKCRFPRTLFGTEPPEGDARTWFGLQNYYVRHLIGRSLKTAEPLGVALGIRRTAGGAS